MPRSIHFGVFMFNKDDQKYMQRALALSLKGTGFVNPNPLVGAVIVKNKKIIGEGFHQSYGGNHAEVNAIESVGGSCKGATMYVTLEPCNHHGKTPPCSEQITLEKFRKVVFGMKDPNPGVEGNGEERLRKAGIEVAGGLLEEKIRKANEVFVKYTEKNIPFCAMKTAMTLDGKIATYAGDSRWISNEKSRSWVHELRHKYSGIMVGVNTVKKDDPELTDRSGNKDKKNPVRIIADSNASTPLKAKILNTAFAETIIAVTEKADEKKIARLKKKGVKVILCPELEGRVNLRHLLGELGKMGLDSILLEGGSHLNFSAIREGVVDKVYSFISPKMIGGSKAHTPIGGDGFEKIDDAITLNIDKIKRFDEDILIEAYITGK